METYNNIINKYQKALRYILIFFTFICIFYFVIFHYDQDSWFNTDISTSTTTTTTVVDDLEIVSIAAVGDISCSQSQRMENIQSNCKDQQVAQLIQSYNVDQVWALGDIQYNTGKLKDFQENFIPNWKNLFSIIKPIPGNHDYYTPGAKGYYEVFSDYPKPGYYSFDLNDTWHVVALNTNNDCAYVYCDKNSDQYKWLQKDLSLNSNKCIVAMSHHPRYASESGKQSYELSDIYKLLTDYKVSALFSAHDHAYERLSTPVPQYIIGTGGEELRNHKRIPHENSEFIKSDSFGFLQIIFYGKAINTMFISVDNTIVDNHIFTCNK